jgi:hypothetical protein
MSSVVAQSGHGNRLGECLLFEKAGNPLTLGPGAAERHEGC